MNMKNEFYCESWNRKKRKEETDRRASLEISFYE